MIDQMIDLRNIHLVEIEVSREGNGQNKVWVNINNKCALRIQGAEIVIVKDDPQMKLPRTKPAPEI